MNVSPCADDMMEAYGSCYEFNRGSAKAIRRRHAERARDCMEGLVRRCSSRDAPKSRARQIVLPSGKTIDVEPLE